MVAGKGELKVCGYSVESVSETSHTDTACAAAVDESTGAYSHPVEGLGVQYDGVIDLCGLVSVHIAD